MNIAISILDISQIGGAERVVINLTRYLSKKHTVTIISLLSNGLTRYDNEFHIIHCNYDRPMTAIARLRLRRFPPKSLVALLNSFDLVISNNIFRNFINPYHITTKKIDLHHLNYEESSGKISFQKKMGLISRNQNFKSLDKLVVLTKQDEMKFRKAGLKKIVTIPNGLSFLPGKLSDLNQKQVIAIGRLHYDKGMDSLIKAWCKVNLIFPDWKLKIYGEGQERNNLENLIIDFNLSDSIYLLGTVDHIMEKIMESSVFVMSSHFEGFGMTILESMACGLPVVSFNCPTGPREILQSGKYGLLAKDQDVDDLAKNIIILLESKELREEFGKKARERALDYSWEIIGPKWDNLINSI